MRITLLLLYAIVVKIVFPHLGTAEAPVLTQGLRLSQRENVPDQGMPGLVFLLHSSTKNPAYCRAGLSSDTSHQKTSHQHA